VRREPAHHDDAAAQRLLTDRAAGKDDESRIRHGLRLVASRHATPEETASLRQLLEDQRAAFRADVEAAKKLLAVGDAPADEKIEPAEAAAWATVGSALLNLDAAIRRG
jgi:hypothetical protein